MSLSKEFKERISDPPVIRITKRGEEEKKKQDKKEEGKKEEGEK